MSKKLSEEEKEFNYYIKSLDNYPTFKANDFRDDKQVQKMFNHYFSEIKPGIYGRALLIDELNTYNKYHNREMDNRYTDSYPHSYYIRNLFKISNDSLAGSIFCDDYRGLLENQSLEPSHKAEIDTKTDDMIKVETRSLQEVQLDEERVKKVELKKKIDSWLQFCESLNDVKRFILARHPTWEDMKLPAKEKAREELITLSEQLDEILNLDRNIIGAILSIAIRKYSLNQTKKLKIHQLLYLKLPNIDTEEKATAIVESLHIRYKEPYKEYLEKREINKKKKRLRY